MSEKITYLYDQRNASYHFIAAENRRLNAEAMARFSRQLVWQRRRSRLLTIGIVCCLIVIFGVIFFVSFNIAP